MNTLRMAIAVAPLILTSAIAAFGAAGQPLTIDGAAVSTDVRSLDGRAYVPVADIAKYLNMHVTHTTGAYALTTGGGAGQDNGARQGKIGVDVFTGKWRFQVVDVKTADTYDEQYYQLKNKVDPHPGDSLVVVDCLLKNATTKTITPLLTERLPFNTALADANGQSYAPLDVDARQNTTKIGGYDSAPMLPGSKVKFALVFSVPKGTDPVALVYTLADYPDDVGGKGVDVRISLK